ncbi:MAG TPA: ACT domain-containing protein [Ilumatobacteraceae bacterium]|nr:ACT domain-containing protein [Ilumatobacteraceae bacterium]
MVAPGETDLELMLATLAVQRRPGVFTYIAVEVPTPGLIASAHAVIKEGRLTTIVLPVDAAERAGQKITGQFAWLTLTVQSSLDAVGLTAAVSESLTAIDVSCNVLAGYHHDHLLIPLDRVDDAIAALTA